MSAPSVRTEPLRVMHVITDLDVGGAEGMLSELVRHRDPAREDAIVSLMPGGVYRERISAAGVAVSDLGMRRGVPGLRPVLALARRMRAWRPDVVHSWLYHADLLATLALYASGRRRATRLVWGLRCAEMSFRDYSRMTGLVVRCLARLSGLPDVVVSNSEAGCRVHRRLGYRPRRWAVLANGVDTGRFRWAPALRERSRDELGLPEDAFVVGMCARVDPMKDHETFVRAAKRFREGVPGARFVLAGRGTDAADGRVSRMLREHGLADAFRCLGEVAEVHRLLPAFDVATLASAGEGFPNVLVEAMACEIPCVTMDVGDARRIVGEAGVVVPVRDPERLAAGWAALARRSPGERRALGAAARRRVESEFALDSALARYRAFYRDLAG